MLGTGSDGRFLLHAKNKELGDEGFFEATSREIFGDGVCSSDTLSLRPVAATSVQEWNSRSTSAPKCFLTSAGRTVFDAFYLNHIYRPYALLACKSIDFFEPVHVTLPCLFQRIKLLLFGVSSDYFFYDEIARSFCCEYPLFVSGVSCESLQAYLVPFLDAGAQFLRVANFLTVESVELITDDLSALEQAFRGAMSEVFLEWQRTLLDICDAVIEHDSLLALVHALRQHLSVLRLLANLCSEIEEQGTALEPNQLRLLDVVLDLWQTVAGTDVAFVTDYIWRKLFTACAHLLDLSTEVGNTSTNHFSDSIFVVDWHVLGARDVTFWKSAYQLKSSELIPRALPLELQHNLLNCCRNVSLLSELRRTNQHPKSVNHPPQTVTSERCASTFDSIVNDALSPDSSIPLELTVSYKKPEVPAFLLVNLERSTVFLDSVRVEWPVTGCTVVQDYCAKVKDRAQRLSRASLSQLFDASGLLTHLTTLRNVFFCADGIFASRFFEELFLTVSDCSFVQRESLASSVYACLDVDECFTAERLNSFLSKALNEARMPVVIRPLLSFFVDFMARAGGMDVRSSKLFDCLTLSYAVPWPVNIVVTESTLKLYNKVFHLFASLHWTMWALRDVQRWLTDRAGYVYGGRLRVLHVYRHIMQHFVQCLYSYVAREVTEVSWTEFHAELATSDLRGIDDVCTLHDRYLERILMRSMCTPKAQKLLDAVHALLDLVLKFRYDLVTTQSLSERDWTRIDQRYRTFQYHANFLLTVIKGLAQRGYERHLHDLLLLINFSNHF